MSTTLKTNRYLVLISIAILAIASIVLVANGTMASENEFAVGMKLDNAQLLNSESLDSDNLSHPLNMAAFFDGVRDMPEEDAMMMYKYSDGVMNSYLVEDEDKITFVAEYMYTYLDESQAARSVEFFSEDAFREGGQLVEETSDLYDAKNTTKHIISLTGDEGDIVYWVLRQQKNQMQLVLVNGFDAERTRDVLESIVK